MQMIEISKLKVHPRNKEFFDDITGERWEDFKQSIIRRGVVESVVATEDKESDNLIIVSGHQRIRACKEIGTLKVPCRIVHYPEKDERLHIPREDMILEDLICTNIMQRGVGNVNPMKMAKCIKELERIYGIHHGGDRGNQYIVANGHNLTEAKTQKNLANKIGIDERQLRNYKKLNELIPELQVLVETGALKSTTAYKIWARLPQDEQEKFFDQIGQDKIKKMTQEQTKNNINKILDKKFRKSISNQVLKSLAIRSNGYCEICNWGGEGLENVLVVHHIHKYCDTKNNSLDNLIMICPNCHGIIHTLENCHDDTIKNSIKNNLNNEIIRKIKLYTEFLIV